MNMAFSGNVENYLDQRLWYWELEKCEFGYGSMDGCMMHRINTYLGHSIDKCLIN